MNEEIIKSIVKDRLTICIKECGYGYNGKEIRVILEWDGEEFDSDGYTIKLDEG